MQIIKTPYFSTELDTVLDFIALDSIDQALKFADDLELKINSIENMPYKYRKSIYFDDEDIRDLIFKGYTVTYYLDTENDKILILGIKKYKKDYLINL